MTSRRTIAVSIAASFVVLGFGAPAALADRKNPLDGQPAVRHRLLLVKQRLEFTTAFESSINADYKHTVGGGVKIEYHLSDMLSIGGVGIYGASFNTGLVKRILQTLPDTSTGDPTPTKAQYRQHLNKMPVHGAAYLSITPWYGKLAAFGKAFVNFDFYFQGGLAFAQLKSNCSSTVCTDTMPGGDPNANPVIPPDNNPNNDPPLNSGTEFGVYLGGGIHVFLNNWIALDLTVRSYAFTDNPSGLDFNADLKVDETDPRFLNHLFFGAGISFFFPPKVKRTP